MSVFEKQIQMPTTNNRIFTEKKNNKIYLYLYVKNIEKFSLNVFRRLKISLGGKLVEDGRTGKDGLSAN
jgi:hypothetical protein